MRGVRPRLVRRGIFRRGGTGFPARGVGTLAFPKKNHGPESPCHAHGFGPGAHKRETGGDGAVRSGREEPLARSGERRVVGECGHFAAQVLEAVQFVPRAHERGGRVQPPAGSHRSEPHQPCRQIISDSCSAQPPG